MYSKKAAGILSKDPTLEKIIQKIPPGTLYKADSSVPLYNYLIRSIVGQQLSTKVAQVIFDRFLDLYGRKMPSAQVLKNTDDELLRSCGLSGQKSSYIKNIASFWIENKLHKTEFSEMEDEERKQYLLSEGFDCQNEPIFLINLKSKIADFLQEEFRNSGVDEVEKLFVNLIYE